MCLETCNLKKFLFQEDTSVASLAYIKQKYKNQTVYSVFNCTLPHEMFIQETQCDWKIRSDPIGFGRIPFSWNPTQIWSEFNERR